MSTGHILLFLFIIGCLWWISQTVENFAYKRNPCGEFTNCSSCANAAGCGWCSDLGQCQPMAQDGFPIRTKDSSMGEDVTDSPYLNESRSQEQVDITSKASRIHICNPYGFVTDEARC